MDSSAFRVTIGEQFRENDESWIDAEKEPQRPSHEPGAVGQRVLALLHRSIEFWRSTPNLISGAPLSPL
jgi:hypothetical protein